jgi:hypothetical protein
VVEELGSLASDLIGKAAKLCESDMSGTLVPR